jgi:hypothetical protein
MSRFTLVDFALCARREVRKRQQVYRRLVEEGKMNQVEADREIELMRAIADHFEELSNPHLPGTEHV